MSISVYISATLRGFANRNHTIQIEGGTVREVLKRLPEEYPELQKALFDDAGRLRAFVNLYLNEENVTAESKWDTAVREEDAFLLLPAIAGGAPWKA